MKIGKVIAILLLSYIFVTSVTYAQKGANASANISISIVKALQINQVKGDLSFAELVQSGVSSKVTRTPDKGILFEVNGAAGREVVVDYQTTPLNNNISSNSSIQFIPEVNHTYSNSNYTNPISVTNGESYQLTNRDGDGLLYLWVGGEMDIDSDLPSGIYTGEFAVTVSY